MTLHPPDTSVIFICCCFSFIPAYKPVPVCFLLCVGLLFLLTCFPCLSDLFICLQPFFLPCCAFLLIFYSLLSLFSSLVRLPTDQQLFLPYSFPPFVTCAEWYWMTASIPPWLSGHTPSPPPSSVQVHCPSSPSLSHSLQKSVHSDKMLLKRRLL